MIIIYEKKTVYFFQFIKILSNIDIFLKYEVSILIWYIICVDIFINKTIIRVNAMKSDILKIDTNNNYVQLSQKIP